MDRSLSLKRSELKMEKAIFGASEFFSENAFITSLRGIENVRIGQPRGTDLDIVEIWFNPWKVSYNELLELFFDLHDPTFKEGQLIQNQSLIFFSDKNQLTLAKQKKSGLKHFYKDKMITKITPASEHFNGLEKIIIS
jgi:peptide-methionine (S)-S-oxide reductase